MTERRYKISPPGRSDDCPGYFFTTDYVDEDDEDDGKDVSID